MIYSGLYADKHIRLCACEQTPSAAAYTKQLLEHWVKEYELESTHAE